jgi:hypothetical protein
MIDIISEKNKIIIKDVTKLFLSIRYFYCAAEDCKNINTGSNIFCDNHNIYNVKNLKSSVDEIPRDEVKRMIKKYIENNYDLLETDLKLLTLLKF